MSSAFITSKSISLATADEISNLAINAAQIQNFNPISITILDSSGAAILTKRMDNCPSNLYPSVSHAKAHTCIAVVNSSRFYANKHLQAKNKDEHVGPDLFTKVLNQVTISGGKMAAFQGGVLIKCKESGQVVGSVGISGATGDEDEYCALYGIHNCSMGKEGLLETVPEHHSCTTLKE